MPINLEILNALERKEKEKVKKVKLKKPATHSYWFMLVNGKKRAGPWKNRDAVEEYIEAHPENAELRPIYKKFQIPLKIQCDYCGGKAPLYDIRKMDMVIYNCGQHKLVL